MQFSHSEKVRKMIEEEWNSLSISDDYIFGRVFSDATLCKKLIELLLNVKVKELSVPPEYQKNFQAGINSRGVRFDVFTESAGEAFDIEIQTTKQTDLPLRMRYYQSSMDTSLIKKGQRFSDLKQTYVLFISTVDQFGYGEPVYEIESSVKRHPEYNFNDKRKEVVYNITAFKKMKNSAVKSFLEYIATGEAKMDFEKEIDDKVVEVKDDEYWKNNYINIQMWKMDAIMEGERRGKTVGMQEGREEGMKQGMKQGMKEGMKEGMKQGRAAGLTEGRALQKDEDEKIIAQKDAEIARLKELLAARN